MDKLDKIIFLIREMMVANAPGTSGGFSTKSPAEGPVAGRDKPLGNNKVQKRYIYGGQKSRKNWIDYLNSKGK